MSVFFPTPLLDYTEKFNREYAINQERIQQITNERVEYNQQKLNDALEARRIKEADEKQAEYEKLSRNQAYEQLERNRQEKYQYFLGTKFDRYI
tara:strand:+ start:575 stop:856 length:282 start_codon:yes stop_codon:yes gene_type:complete